mmetsp:Transcript_9863/g.30424  ORF Transcript_9863/g.30424 Transcript_9863/m.30424 type:complete len:438 (+) Transcript_9863:619-1932(+)
MVGPPDGGAAWRRQPRSRCRSQGGQRQPSGPALLGPRPHRRAGGPRRQVQSPFQDGQGRARLRLRHGHQLRPRGLRGPRRADARHDVLDAEAVQRVGHRLLQRGRQRPQRRARHARRWHGRGQEVRRRKAGHHPLREGLPRRHDLEGRRGHQLGHDPRQEARGHQHEPGLARAQRRLPDGGEHREQPGHPRGRGRGQRRRGRLQVLASLCGLCHHGGRLGQEGRAREAPLEQQLRALRGHLRARRRDQVGVPPLRRRPRDHGRHLHGHAPRQRRGGAADGGGPVPQPGADPAVPQRPRHVRQADGRRPGLAQQAPLRRPLGGGRARVRRQARGLPREPLLPRRGRPVLPEAREVGRVPPGVLGRHEGPPGRAPVVLRGAVRVHEHVGELPHHHVLQGPGGQVLYEERTLCRVQAELHEGQGSQRRSEVADALELRGA